MLGSISFLDGPVKGFMRRRDLLAALPLFATGLLNQSVARTAPVLRVGAALPDPPFEFNAKDGPAGFDITLMQRIAVMLGREWQLVPYRGADFNSIFAGLDDGSYDCVASDLARNFQTYWQTPEADSIGRMKLFKLAWDMVGSELAGRHQQYEKFYAGASFIIRNHSYRDHPQSFLSRDRLGRVP
jgi:ABC-type amino acid transport substrate-binding protein